MTINSPSSRLFEPKQPIFPRRVKGPFRTLKWWLMLCMLGVYYVTPWLRFDRGSEMPDQAVLIDLAHRRFFMFWIEIWPHEFYFIAGLLIMAGIGLFLFTAALGRVWCGYACPQTVWTDLFILVERWIDGDRNSRIRLWNQKWNLDKIIRRLFKWNLWLMISILTGGAWVFYFADAPTLAVSIIEGTAPNIVWTSIGFLTLTTFVFGGFMREQICIYMCPWPRIQAAMMDENTLAISYRLWRGEPRSSLKKKKISSKSGDCIDCNACLNVCPMGIDIRAGQQMQCISCALCIDACNDIMKRLNKPLGLIGYMSLSSEIAEQDGAKQHKTWRNIFQPRIILYTLIWLFVGISLIHNLFIRPNIELSVAPIRNPIYVKLSDGTVRNIYEVRLRNKTATSQILKLGVDSVFSEFDFSMSGYAGNHLTIAPDSTHLQRVYISAPADSLPASTKNTELDIWVKNTDSKKRYKAKTVFNGDI